MRARALTPPPAAGVGASRSSAVWHTVKTGGTTVRTIFQRQAQLGAFSFYYVTHLPAPLWHSLLHALSTDVRPRRLLVELHNPWGVSPAALAQMVALRERYRPVCAVLLVTFVRRPVPLLLSLYNWRVFAATPFCQWLPVTDVQTRTLMGNAVVRAPAEARRLSPRQFGRADAEAAFAQWDLVGVLERFDESLAVLAQLAGLRALAYVRTNSDGHQGEWQAATKRLLRALEHMVEDDGQAAVREAAALNALSEAALAERPPRQPANCEWWGCRPELAATGGVYRPGLCASVPPAEVVHTLSQSQQTDSHLYALALRGLERWHSFLGPTKVSAQLKALAAANKQLLALRAASSARRRPAPLVRARTEGKEGADGEGGVSDSCVGCGREPHSQLNGCWPAWNFFLPDEGCFACTRSWVHDGGAVPNPAVRKRPSQMPCYQDCWQPLSATPSATPAEQARCSRALPAEARQALLRDGRICTAACAAEPTEYGAGVRIVDDLGAASSYR